MHPSHKGMATQPWTVATVLRTVAPVDPTFRVSPFPQETTHHVTSTTPRRRRGQQPSRLHQRPALVPRPQQPRPLGHLPAAGGPRGALPGQPGPLGGHPQAPQAHADRGRADPPGRRLDCALRGLPRAAQHLAWPGQGRRAFPPECDVVRSDGAVGLDVDQERGGQRALRWSQGWYPRRSAPAVDR
ncbi:hypothetical protein Y695_04162 [Hydrogenophaga sp. T4]|nr:hypothetical protein Y695_04162 [Hydrogenophaga sp. T4]